MLSAVILPRVPSVNPFFHLIFLLVLPNGPFRKVCVIISGVHCKEKKKSLSIPIYVLVLNLWEWITFWNLP